MQEYVNLVGSAKVKDSREPINKNFSTVASDFSGESFPTENLIENMTCYRTDLNKTYRYNNGSWVVDGVVSVNGQSPTPSTGNIVLDDYVVSVTADGKTLSIKKKDGTESTINISYNLATQVVDGLMSATDKSKLDNVADSTTPTNDNSKKLVSTEWFRKAHTGVPTGTVIFSASDSVPNGYLVANGQAVSRTAYVTLFTIIGTKYGAGNGSTTFTLPNLIDRVAQGNSTAGTYKSAGLPNITGAGMVGDATSQIATFAHGGAIIPYGTYEGLCVRLTSGYVATTTGGFKFDSSLANSIYGNSPTVQPPALTLLPCIKY